MADVNGFDHIAIAVPNLSEEVDRLTNLMGMVVQGQAKGYALLADSASGFKIELSESADGESHFRHLGFRAEDVDSAHAALVEAGLTSTVAPERRDFARMRTAFLKEPSGLEIQLVKYDQEG
jgi:catechol 2,3-dioxygenase-like lactoylglutathione lyase family enzyme